MIEAKKYILEIDPYKPGKSKTASNGQVIKLSSNENALGSSPKALQAYLDHSKTVFRYADGSCSELRNAIAGKYKIDAEKIVCGAGSDEIIALLTHAFCDVGDEVLYSEYGFLMYPISAKRVGAKPVIAKEIELTANVDNILAQITDKTKIIFLANPNNPTGSYLSHIEVERLIKNVRSDILVVLDLAYAEFVDEADYPDAIKLVNQYENVVMMRTFSKIYGLASLRLGWSYSSLYVADVLNRTRGPFNVSGAAQHAGVAAINDDEFIAKSKAHNQNWLKILAEELTKIGIKFYPSVANFILLDFKSAAECAKANQFLLDNGVILREMGAYNLPNCLRMTIGTDDENKRVLELLKKA
ncbi:MAG: hisC [Rickettsiaceae bacterium]|jgi:histidinol-phosphate aminotransferase|nr:hisC [Rickettsiaceae bacterium]